MSIKDESEKLESALASIVKQWEQELANIEAEIRQLDDILSDKESKTDRSENATFQIAKDTRDIKLSTHRAIDSKIQTYAGYKNTYVPTGVITVGSTVEVLPLAINSAPYNDERAHKVLKLVELGLSDAKSGLVGVDSAIGSALLGLREGDTLSIKTRKGIVTYKIERMY